MRPSDAEQAAIDQVRQKHPAWRDAEGARNRCIDATDELIAQLPDAQRLWVRPDEREAHCMALLPSGAVADLTAAQYGTPSYYATLDQLLETYPRYRISDVDWRGPDWVTREGYEPPQFDPPEPAKLQARRTRVRR